MKRHIQYLLAAVLASGLLLSQTALAGDCCTKAAAKAKKGETCAACEKNACCKETVEKLAKDGKAKACEKCAAQEKKKKSS